MLRLDIDFVNVVERSKWVLKEIGDSIGIDYAILSGSALKGALGRKSEETATW
jgi:hypothetical protein